MQTIAYIAGQFPLRSETFVWREVRELRRRGWTVHTFGLRAPAEVPEALADLRAATRDVYAMNEALSPRDIATAAKVGSVAFADAMWPGETSDLRGRAATIAQAQAACRLAVRLRSLGVRHVHAHFAHAPASVAMYAATFLGIPFSFTGHANDLFQRRQLLRRKLKRAAFVSCISEWHRAFYNSIVRRDDEAYPIVRCGVDTDDLAPASRSSSGAMRVLMVCRLVEKKGADALVGAVAMLRDRGVACALTIAGDGPMRANLEAMARRLSVVDRVTFVGAVDAARVRSLMLESDAFALPCRVDSNGDRDGIPVVLMEAMACGVPVISGDLPAIRELVAHGDTGLLVADGAAAGLADALQRLDADPALAARLSAAGRGRVVSEFSLRLNVSRLETRFIAV